MKNNYFDKNSAIEAVSKLNEEELLFLDRLIVERLKLISQAKSTVMMSNFHVGERVCFTACTGNLKRGVILKLNKKTASIKTDDGNLWNVAPALLKKIKKGTGQFLNE